MVDSVVFFSTQSYERKPLERACGDHLNPKFLSERLDETTAHLAKGFRMVNLFVEDIANRAVLEQLAQLGVRLIALRCTGYDRVDLQAAEDLGIQVCNVPGYTPYAVAEYSLLLMLALLRKFPQTDRRVHAHDFSLQGLEGRCLHGRTVGIIGYGHIGHTLVQLLEGFGCTVLVFDPYVPAASIEGQSVSLEELLSQSDIVSIHCCLSPASRHLLNAQTLGLMKTGSILINTARGAILDTEAAFQALEEGRLAGLALDVYEREAGLFFHDHSKDASFDPLLKRLLDHPQVIVTGHEAFLTEEALAEISATTVQSMVAFAEKKALPHELRPSR